MNQEQSDRRIYDAAIAALESGTEELIPAEFASRLIDGEAALRVWREYRGLTQSALADKAGVDRVQIANMEGGDASGSVATLAKLAHALGIAIEDLV